MIDLDDNRWKSFEGGYRSRFDASILLKKLAGKDSNYDAVMAKLWEELHHQGNIGVASYASVPHIVRIYKERDIFDWNFPCMLAIINRCRYSGKNPDIPDWLREDYDNAIFDAVSYCCCKKINKEWTPITLNYVLMLIATVKGNQALAELIEYIEPGSESEQLESMICTK